MQLEGCYKVEQLEKEENASFNSGSRSYAQKVEEKEALGSSGSQLGVHDVVGADTFLQSATDKNIHIVYDIVEQGRDNLHTIIVNNNNHSGTIPQATLEKPIQNVAQASDFDSEGSNLDQGDGFSTVLSKKEEKKKIQKENKQLAQTNKKLGPMDTSS